MKRMVEYVWVTVIVMVLCVGVAMAAFEPLFQTMNVEGKCSVQTPDEKGAVDAEANKAYPYGSQIKTAKSASLLVQFAEGNTCGVGEGASVLVGEDPSDASKKILGLDAGKLGLSLAENFEAENAIVIETACAVVQVLKGPKCSVDAMTEGDLNLAMVMAQNATLSVMGPEFELAALDGEDVLSVACSMDKTFVRVKNVKGEFDVAVTDSEGNPRIVPMKEGATIKIWQKASESADELIVTLLITGADGTLLEAINYRKSIEGGTAIVTKPADQEQQEKDEGKAEESAEDEIQPGESVVAPPATTTLGSDGGPQQQGAVIAAPAGGRGRPGPPPFTPTNVGQGRDD